MTDKELLDIAVCFDLGPIPILNGTPYWWQRYTEHHHHNVYLRKVSEHSWSITEGNFCLNKQGQWCYQPLPSERDNDFIKQCRYESREAALAYYHYWYKRVMSYCLMKMKHAADPEQVIINWDEIPLDKLAYDSQTT